MRAAPKPAKPFANAIENAMSPRVLQPSKSTGNKAMAKKRTGMMDGIMKWRKICPFRITEYGSCNQGLNNDSKRCFDRLHHIYMLFQQTLTRIYA
jgi:hypothetical protein